MIPSRRMVLRAGAGVCVTAAAFGLSACGSKPGPAPQDPDVEGEDYIDPRLAKQEGTLEWAVTGKWRSLTDKARDRHRHPLETLKFFEIAPKHKVLDLWPGAGYTTEILAPYLNKGKGQYVAGLFETQDNGDQARKALNESFRAKFGGNRKIYGNPKFSAFGADTTALAEEGTLDCALFLLITQDLMATGIAEKAFRDAFAALKPGGILGVEQHRADIGNVQDPAATNGYVQEPFVRQLATEAGFQFVGASELNANPKDDKDHPFGVWTLPPQRLTAPRGAPPNPEFDGTLYESIGESDRMTLKFKKPQ